MNFINSIQGQEELIYLFSQIDDKQYYDKIQFYWEYQNHIEKLQNEFSIGLRIEVCRAYFETAQYQQVLDISTKLLEDIIIQNYFSHKGEDAFQMILFKKAAAHYNLLEFDESQKVLTHLLKLNGKDELAQYLLKKTIFAQFQKYYKIFSGIAIGLVLFGSLIYVINALVVEPFEYTQFSIFPKLAAYSIIGGFGILFFNEVFTRLRMENGLKKTIFDTH